MNVTQGKQSRAKGLALIAVLWAIALLSIMAGSFSLSLQRDAGLLNHLQERARGLALADAGVHYAMLMLSLPDPVKRWRGSDAIHDVPLPGGRVRLKIGDEAGKIDLNTAQEATLNAIFTKLLGNPDRAAALSDAILDWRDADDLKRLHGAEAGDYRAAGKSYVPANTNFRALEELQMVHGMTPALYRRLEPMLTLYTRQDGINPMHAARETLLSLPGLDEKTVDEYLLKRQMLPPNTSPPPLPVAPGSVRLNAATDIAYNVSVEALLDDGSTAGLKTVLRRQQARNGLPFVFLDWKPQTTGTLGLFTEPQL